MRTKWMLCVWMAGILAFAATLAHAKDQKPYQTATLLRMNSVKCGTAQKDATSPLSEIIGTDNRSTRSEEVLCPEYVLQTETVVYHIRPRDEKHPDLLPVGSQAQFRIEKDKMLLRVEGVQDKERPYIVVSMMPRDTAGAAQASASSQQ